MNTTATISTKSEPNISKISYQAFNETEASVSKNKAKLECARDKINNCISNNIIILKNKQEPNPLSRIIKSDGPSKIITLRIGTRPMHKLVVDAKYNNIDILEDLKARVSRGDFDREIQEFYSKPLKRKSKKTTSYETTPPELNINYEAASEVHSSKKK